MGVWATVGDAVVALMVAEGKGVLLITVGNAEVGTSDEVGRGGALNKLHARSRMAISTNKMRRANMA